jgi:hypothetical protein
MIDIADMQHDDFDTSKNDRTNSDSTTKGPSIEALINEELISAKHKFVFKMEEGIINDAWKLRGKITGPAGMPLDIRREHADSAILTCLTKLMTCSHIKFVLGITIIWLCEQYHG